MKTVNLCIDLKDVKLMYDLYFSNSMSKILSICPMNLIGPSRVRALPFEVAAERSVHYFCTSHSLLSFLRHILFSQKGFSFFAESFRLQKIRFGVKNIWNRISPPRGPFLVFFLMDVELS